MTATLTCPGYASEASTLRAMSFDRSRASWSETFAFSTMTRTSRPAWIANAFHAGKLVATRSRSASRWT
jgi:hypothetical protein